MTNGCARLNPVLGARHLCRFSVNRERHYGQFQAESNANSEAA